MSARRALAALITLALTAGPLAAHAAERLTVGVFIPESGFTTNAERSAYAQRLAGVLGAALGDEVDVVARTFARRADVIGFVQAKRVDVLIADGLFMSDQRGTIIAHQTAPPRAALYVRPGTRMADLNGGTVAVSTVGADDARFYANTALQGEIDPSRFFASVRPAKDAGAALGAVRSNAADAAFAPAGHAEAAGLVKLVSGGALPGVVAVVIDTTAVDAARQQIIVEALTGGAGSGGGISGWRAGAGDGVRRAKSQAQARPRVLTTPPLLTAPAADGLKPPPMVLTAQGSLSPPTVRATDVTVPSLPPE